MSSAQVDLLKLEEPKATVLRSDTKLGAGVLSRAAVRESGPMRARVLPEVQWWTGCVWYVWPLVTSAYAHGGSL